MELLVVARQRHFKPHAVTSKHACFEVTFHWLIGKLSLYFFIPTPKSVTPECRVAESRQVGTTFDFYYSTDSVRHKATVEIFQKCLNYITNAPTVCINPGPPDNEKRRCISIYAIYHLTVSDSQ